MPEQLTFGGGSVPYPIPEPPSLTTRQRELLLVLRGEGPMTTAQLRRLYADPNGVIRRLRKLGLIRRVGRGRWAAA